MKPISAWHKYALRDEMTTDAPNFRELAFRQTSSRPRPSPSCSLAAQTTSKASRPPGLAGAIAGSSGNSPHLRRPPRRGRPPRAASLQPSPRSPPGPGPDRVPIREQPLAASREEPEPAGYLRARPSSARARKTAKRVPLPAPRCHLAPSGPDPHIHTRAPLHTRAHTRTLTRTARRASALPRALTPAHTQAVTKEGASAALLFFRFSFAAPQPRPGARPTRPPRPPTAAGGRQPERRGAAANFAPGGRETKAAALPEAARPRCAR